MATAADLVRDSCGQLAAYRDRLEREVTEPSSSQGGMAPRPADAPFPGDAQAFAALMVIWEAIPRLRARLLYELTGHPGMRHPGEPGFLDALAAIPKLAAGLDEDTETWAASALEWLVDVARRVPAIDEAQKWRYVRGRACPYCGCWAVLRVRLDANSDPTSHVECHAAPVVRNGKTVWCIDGNGMRPVAAMGTDDRGRPVLQWADGLCETAPDSEE